MQGPTEVLSVLDQQRVERDPVLPGEDLPQAFLRLLGGAGAHDPEAVRDPVHVGVDGDRRDPVAEDQDAVRGLRADPGERRELVEVLRDHARKSSEDLGGARADRPRLGVVEARSPNERLDGPGGRCRETHGVRVPGEQARARGIGRLVPGALGEDRPDEHLERVLRVVPEVRRPPVPGVIERREPVEDGHPIERGPVRHRFRLPVGRAGGLAADSA